MMFRWLLITLLSLGIVGVSVWGYQEHQEKKCHIDTSREQLPTLLS